RSRRRSIFPSSSSRLKTSRTSSPRTEAMRTRCGLCPHLTSSWPFGSGHPKKLARKASWGT
ncbi:hypothetical protein Rleg9DRAFT_6107, partial [Rhizobium leguminosarum bv. trifolii WSM597]